MKKIIKSEIYHDGEFYCARCIDFDVFTQGETLDELVANLKEAIALHIEDEPLSIKRVKRDAQIMRLLKYKYKLLRLSTIREDYSTLLQ